jgi:hypothetical protein
MSIFRDRRAPADPQFFEGKPATLLLAAPDESGAHLADADTTVGDSQASADPIPSEVTHEPG